MALNEGFNKKTQFIIILISAIIVIGLVLCVHSCIQQQTIDTVLKAQEESQPSINVEGDTYNSHTIIIYDGDDNEVASYVGNYNALRNGQVLLLTDNESDDIINIKLGDSYTIVDKATKE